ncbi:protein of unknown function [Bradyrhizobium vignae]|uniref:Uncharacterized protein n=1 Tax=Bradyrhizobium vignae TaxID=1549949 RepID=A0A2U3PUE1_9BRAD|nr:protein of unknown function [Bradyrhizobium vignae]
MEHLADGLIEAEMPLPKPVRLLGVSLASPQMVAAAESQPVERRAGGSSARRWKPRLRRAHER